jgi:hypothetical protein
LSLLFEKSSYRSINRARHTKIVVTERIVDHRDR